MAIDWSNAGAAKDWYTAANWAPPTGVGAWALDDVAHFSNTGTATKAQINMSLGNLSLGAINVSIRNRNLIIGNSSPVAGTGRLQLNGATVEGVNNVILATAGASPPTYAVFIKNKLAAASPSLMEIVLGNSTDNVILLRGEGIAVNISAPISGAGKKLTLVSPTTTGGILTLTGANTYTGLTTVNARHMGLILAKPGGGTLPAANSVNINDGFMRINTNQTLHNVKVSGLGALEIAPGVKLTITGTLQCGTVDMPAGNVRGTVVFT
jgi:hypothetical protein